MPLLNLRLARPDVVIDINRVGGLDRIDVTEHGVRVGALVRAECLVHDYIVQSASTREAANRRRSRSSSWPSWLPFASTPTADR